MSCWSDLRWENKGKARRDLVTSGSLHFDTIANIREDIGVAHLVQAKFDKVGVSSEILDNASLSVISLLVEYALWSRIRERTG